jgi:hypothetical protein
MNNTKMIVYKMVYLPNLFMAQKVGQYEQDMKVGLPEQRRGTADKQEEIE